MDGPAEAAASAAVAPREVGEMSNPLKTHEWLKPFLNASDISEIEEAVAELERKTAGEVIPMVVYRSSQVGHIPLLIFSVGLLFFYIFGIQEQLSAHFVNSSWGLWGWLLFLVPTTWFLSKAHWVQRFLVSSIDREAQALQRAEVEFYRAGLNKTDGSTGVLLFVSVVDHKAVVLGDEAISKKIDTEQWRQVVDTLIKGIRKKNMKTGFIEALRLCAEPLETHFPIAPDDVNEIPNTLIIKD